MSIQTMPASPPQVSSVVIGPTGSVTFVPFVPFRPDVAFALGYRLAAAEAAIIKRVKLFARNMVDVTSIVGRVCGKIW